MLLFAISRVNYAMCSDIFVRYNEEFVKSEFVKLRYFMKALLEKLKGP